MKAIILLCLLAVAIAKPIIDVEIINQVNNGKNLWKAGINHNFIGKTHEDAKRLCGTFLEGGEKLDARPVFEHEMAAPESFDAREQWGEQCPSTKEIRDQSNCGSCWAMGAVEAMTDRVCIASQGAQKHHLSAADMLSCCGSCGSGCSGGYPSAAWSYWRATGLVTGGNYKEGLCYPYQLEPCDHHVNGTLKPCPAIVPTPKCPKKCENGADWNADKHFGASSYSVSGEEAMKTELFNHGPFEVAFTVYEDFLSYRSGVYHHVTGQYEGGHAVKVIGYGTDNGQKYWTIANSWNTEWGSKGTFNILRGKNECGIEGQGVAGLPKL